MHLEICSLKVIFLVHLLGRWNAPATNAGFFAASLSQSL